MSIAYFDAHAHLQDKRLESDLATILAKCRRVGVARWVVNGTRESDWSRVRALADFHADLTPSFGLHPWYAATRSSDWLAQLDRELQGGAIGVGEIGLDRWIRNHNINDQKLVFLNQLLLAHSHELPASIHCLGAWGHLLECLQEAPRLKRGFLLHSYGGPREMVAQFAKLGAYFSLSGYFFHGRKRQQLETLLHTVPSDRLLLETDAPDMALPEHDEKAFNSPRNLIAIYQCAAEALEEPIDQFACRIAENFQCLFGSS